MDKSASAIKERRVELCRVGECRDVAVHDLGADNGAEDGGVEFALGSAVGFHMFAARNGSRESRASGPEIILAWWANQIAPIVLDIAQLMNECGH